MASLELERDDMRDREDVSILFILDGDISSDPRPRRMFQWASSLGRVTTVTPTFHADADESIILPPRITGKGVSRALKRAVEGVRRITLPRIGFCQNIVWTNRLRRLARSLRGKSYDLILVHELHMLPFAFAVARDDSKVVFDAREFYPAQMSDNLLWRLLFQPTNQWLCREFLQKCDLIFTVSEGLAELYRQMFSVRAEVLLSCADYWDVSPRETDEKQIRLIYHGIANKSRRTDLMIKAMDHVRSEFCLDVMAVCPNRRYARYLERLAAERNNVRLISPVEFERIVPKLTEYDIGIFVVPETNVNLKHCMPNKLFEFIQGRLAVLVGPSPDMKSFVEKNRIGFVTNDFSDNAIASKINQLSAKDIDFFKSNTTSAACRFNGDVVGAAVKDRLRDLLTSPPVKRSRGHC